MISRPWGVAATIALLVFLMLGCSENQGIAGATSETTNGISASIRDTQGKPVGGALVRLRNRDYVTISPLLAKSVIGLDALTDSSGSFDISGINPGNYRIEVTKNCTATLFDFSIDQASTIDLGTNTLKTCASIEGSLDSAAGTRFVQVYGLERLVPVRPDGRFTIADLPEGIFDLRIVSMDNSAAPIEIAELKASSDETTVVAIDARWRYARRFYLNTTATGADVMNPVFNFPLLIRLDSTNFDFARGQNAGVDLMFVNATGTALPFEMELWDAASKRAALWVSVDTIRGNDSRQFIVMLWGNDSMNVPRANPVVFDTANGHVGVWHFDPQEPGSDATGNGFTAQDVGTTPVKGPIGEARFFDGNDTMMVADSSALEPSTFTISCWFRRQGAQNTYAKLVSKGKDDSAYASYTIELREQSDVAGFQIATIDTVVHFVETQAVIEDTTWYFLAGVYNGTSGAGELFLNGVSQGAFVAPVPIDYYPARRLTLNFGGIKGSRFVGSIDEVRLSNRALSSDYIKLSYENQRSGSNFIAIHRR